MLIDFLFLCAFTFGELEENKMHTKEYSDRVISCMQAYYEVKIEWYEQY